MPRERPLGSNSRPPCFGIAAAISSPTTAKARGTQHYLGHRSIASTCARPLTARLLYPKELKIQPCRAAPCDAFRDALSASGTVITPAPVNTHCFQPVLATSNAVLCVPATAQRWRLGPRAPARRGTLLGQVSRIRFRADAAFAMHEVYEFLKAERIKYAIRLAA